MLTLEQVNEYTNFKFIVSGWNIPRLKLSEVSKGDEIWYAIGSTIRTFASTQIISIAKNGIVKTDSGINFTGKGSSRGELSGTKRIDDLAIHGYSPQIVVDFLLERLARHKSAEVIESSKIIKYTLQEIEKTLALDASLAESISPMLDSIISILKQGKIELWKAYEDR